MVDIDKTQTELKQKNLEISDIIDETIADYQGTGLTFYRNEWANPDNPDNWLFSDKNQDNMIFNGELRTKDYRGGRAVLKVIDPSYFDWAMDVATKIETKLGLNVTLEELYD